MSRFSVLCSLAIVSLAGNLLALEDRPTVTVTKDDVNYYAWHCDQRLNSNDMGIPVDIAALAIKDGYAQQVDTTKAKIVGFAGLTKESSVRTRGVQYDDSKAMLKAQEWNDEEKTSKTNVPMLAILIFGLFVITTIALRNVKAVSPKFFRSSINAAVCSIGLMALISFLFGLINRLVPIPGWAVIIGLVAALTAGILLGLITAMGKNLSDPKKDERRLKLSLAFHLPIFAVILPLWLGGLPGMLSMMALAAGIFLFSWLSSSMKKALKDKKDRKAAKDESVPRTSPSPA